jgi:hypothetical protein
LTPYEAIAENPFEERLLSAPQAPRALFVSRGTQVLIPPYADRRKGRQSRRGWDDGFYSFMRRAPQSEHGASLYRKRQAMVEPVFGDMKFNRRSDRFLRRARSAVRSEWRLATANNKLLKLHRHKIASATA